MKLLNEETKLRDLKLVAIDVETTGLKARNGDRIIQLSGVKFKPTEHSDRELFDNYVNPDRFIPYSAWQIHNIDYSDIKDCPKIDKILPDFVEFIQQSVLVGHNVKFDIRFINSALKRNGRELMQNQFVDTLKLSRYLLPSLQSHKLGKVAERLNINLDLELHDALNDAIVAKKIFIKSLPYLEDEGVKNVKDAKKLSIIA